jgi:hypothetical protein
MTTTAWPDRNKFAHVVGTPLMRPFFSLVHQ